MHPRLRAVVAAVVTGVLAALLFTPASSQAATVAGLDVAARHPGIVGVDYHPLWSDAYPDAASRTRALDTFAAAGATSVRMDISWTQVEPSGDNVYDTAALAALDQRIKEVTDRHMSIVGMVWAAPKWVSGVADPLWPTFGKPSAALTAAGSGESYGDFLAYLANRYPGVVWEMWNEPDQPGFWADAVDPSRTDTLPERASTYAAAMVRAYDRAHAGAPQATFLLAGPAGLGLADGWFSALYATRTTDAAGRTTGVATHHDGVAVHPYVQPSDVDPLALPASDNWSAAGLSRVYDAMVAAGDGDKRMWATEYGSSTHWNNLAEGNWQIGVDARRQAVFLQSELDVLATLKARDGTPLVRAAYVYTDKDHATTSPQTANYGLLTRAGVAKPALYALTCAATTAPGVPCPVKTVRPEQFGARGDGVSNDADAFQRAADAAGAGGVLLLTSARTYQVGATPSGSPVTLTAPSMRVSSDGATPATLRTSTAVRITGDYVAVDRVNFEAGTAPTPAGSGAGAALWVAGGTGAVIDQVAVTGTGNGVWVSGATGATVRRTSVARTVGDAVTVTDGANSTTVDEVTVTAPGGRGITVAAPATSTATTNVAVDDTTVASAGTDAAAVTGGNNVFLRRFTATSPAGAGLAVLPDPSSAAVGAVTVRSGTVTSPGGAAVNVRSTSGQPTGPVALLSMSTVNAPPPALRVARTPAAGPLDVGVASFTVDVPGAAAGRFVVDTAAGNVALPAGEVHGCVSSTTCTGSGGVAAPVAGAPAAPTGVRTVDVTNRSVSVAFTEPSGVDVYGYEFSIDGGQTWSLPTIVSADAGADPLAAEVQAKTSPLTVSGLSPATGYTILVRTVTVSGRSAPSAPVTATTRAGSVQVPAGQVVVVHASDGARTVLGNLTSTAGTGAGQAVVYPCALGRPATVNLQFSTSSVASFVAARTDADGNLCIYTTAATHLLWDQVSESDAPGHNATRSLDTRPAGAPVPAGTTVTVPVGADAAGDIVFGTVSAVSPGASGWMTVWPCGQARPTASSINFPAGTSASVGVAARADSAGQVCVYTNVASHILFDHVAALPLPGHAPARLLDTRLTSSTPLPAGSTVTVNAGPGSAGKTLLGTVTSTGSKTSGWVAVYPCKAGRPVVSNVNYALGVATANGAAVTADEDGNVCLYTSGSSHVLWDQSSESTLAAHTPIRLLDTRTSLV